MASTHKGMYPMNDSRETEIDDALCAMHDDISAAHEFTTAIARLTETLDPVDGLVFQRIAGRAIDHIKNIQRHVDELRQSTAACIAAAA
jgi:hypothetical protein